MLGNGKLEIAVIFEEEREIATEIIGHHGKIDAEITKLSIT